MKEHKKVAPSKRKLEITDNVGWAKEFWDNLVPYKDQVRDHKIFQDMGSGKLSVKKFQKGLLNFYPLVENFPKYMGLTLAKVRISNTHGHEEAKRWLIGNIKVEQNHTEWYEDWAMGFGLSQKELRNVRPDCYMDAINNFLWKTTTYDSLAESLGAVNLAVEWATGEWSQKVIEGVKSYLEKGLVENNIKTMAWIKAHAIYDDVHPYEAMELIKLCATTKEEQEKAFFATKRALEYYILALDEWERYNPGE